NSDGAPAAKTQPMQVTIGTAASAADLSVGFAKNLNSMPAFAANPVSLVFTVQNSVNGSTVPANLAIDFSAPVQMGTLPVGCTRASANSIACSFTSANGVPAPFSIPINAPFAQLVSA